MYFRLIRPGDFAACVRMTHPGFNASARVRAAMPTLWRRLLTAGQLHGGVVVEPRSARAAEVVAFGLSVFLEDQFVEDYLRAPTPFPSALVYEHMLKGRSPVLEGVALREANTAGSLNLLILHFGVSLSDPPTPRELTIVATAHGGFRLTHEGYHVRRVIQEGYGAAHVAFLKAGGFCLGDDFAAHYQRVEQAPAPAERPYLMLASRSDLEGQLPGSTLSFLFVHTSPRFKFSPAAQRVLLRALMDESDETISAELAVSRDAVKKVWRRIYEKVSAVEPALLDGESADQDLSGQGKRRRLQLLRYLRYHMEELRPFVLRSRRHVVRDLRANRN